MRRWRRVRMTELNEIWAMQQAQGVCYNGCTSAELLNRYGAGNVPPNKRGRGWYKLTAE